MTRIFLDTATSPYVIAFVGFLLLTLLLPGLWRLHSVQIAWILLTFLLAVVLLGLTFPFAGMHSPLSAAFYFYSTAMLGLLAALSWKESFHLGLTRTTIAGALIVAMLIFYGYLEGGGDLRRVWGPTYLGMGTVVALGFSFSFPYLMASGGFQKIGWLIVVLICTVGLVTGQARGPVLFSAFAALIMLLFYWPKSSIYTSTRMGLAGRAGFVGIAAAITIFLIPTRQINRLARLFRGDELELGGRGRIWAEALQTFSDAPFLGHGLGYSTADYYPHNLFLQVGVDAGIVGILALAVLISWPVCAFIIGWANRAVRSQPLTWGLLAAYIVLVLDYSKSYDFYKSRMLFLVGGALVSHIVLQWRAQTHSLKEAGRRSSNISANE